MTAKDRIDYLLGKALSGELNPEERRELDAVLASDPDLADAFIRDSRFGALLSLALEEGEGAERFERALRARHHAAGENADFISQLHRRAPSPAGPRPRVPSHRRVRPTYGPLVWGLAAAAAVLLVLALVVALQPNEEAPGPVVLPPQPEPEPVVKALPAPVPPPAPARSTPAGTRPGMPEPELPPLPELKPEPDPVVPKPVIPEPPPKPDPPKAPRETRVAAATIERAFGHAFAVDGDRRIPLRNGDVVRQGQGLFTWGARSRVQMRFGDRTLIRLHGNSAILKVSNGSEEAKEGKHLRITRGSLTADIPKQNRLRPMIIDTPRGEMKILGTTIRLEVDPARTRLEVMEGRVRLTRKKDKKFAYVGTGQYAVAAEGESLTPKTLVLKRAFQNGSHPVTDYKGSQDTMIYEVRPDRVLGDDRILEVGGKQLGILLRWDLSRVARGSKVREASLALRPLTPFPPGQIFHVYEAKRPWVEGEATWKHYARGKRWQAAGARGPADRGSRSLGVLMPADNHTCRVRLNAQGVALVQSWIRNPSKNYGLVLVGEAAHQIVGFASGDAPGQGERPWLTLTYVPGKR